MISCRRTQKEKAEREAAELAKQSVVPPQLQMPEIPMPGSSMEHQTDDSNGPTPPASASPVVRPKQAVTSTLTTPIGRGRGRPRKYPQPPTTEDKPKNASKAEMLRWQKKYNTAKWRYDKLTSQDAESFRKQENERVKKTRQAE